MCKHLYHYYLPLLSLFYAMLVSKFGLAFAAHNLKTPNLSDLISHEVESHSTNEVEILILKIF